MAKKVTVQFELDLDTAKELAAANKTATRRLTAKDLELLADHGQLKASSLLGEEGAASAVGVITALQLHPEVVPTISRQYTRQFQVQRFKSRPISAQLSSQLSSGKMIVAGPAGGDLVTKKRRK